MEPRNRRLIEAAAAAVEDGGRQRRREEEEREWKGGFGKSTSNLVNHLVIQGQKCHLVVNARRLVSLSITDERKFVKN